MDAAPPRLVPARMLNEFAYCPRLFHLEWVQGEFAHSEDTLEGALTHRRVDEERGSLPPPEELAPEDRIAARSVLLSSPDLGMIARLDLLEGANGTVRPVDYKKGAPGSQGPWEPELVQLCAQGLLLRENGYHCEDGVLYFAATKQRVPVVFDDDLVARTRQLLGELREAVAQTVPPPPLVDSPKCPRCSLVGICLPDEVNLLRGIPLGEVRRLVPGRADAGLVYVVEQGASVGKTGERLVIRRREGSPEHLRLLDVASLSVYGNVSISAQAIRALTEQEIPILHHTYGGWLVALTTGVAFRNVELRCRQHRLADDPAACLPLAQAVVVGKIKNQRTLLRRNHRLDPQLVLRELSRLGMLAHQVASIDQLLGIEGLAAKAYFAHFAGMLREDSGFDFRARVRRPPTDPVNAVLSFLYSLLTRDAVVALLGVGLDPYRGILHQLHYGRPSLALDLAEEFRALLADSVALTLLNNRVLSPGDFLRRGRAVALTDQARRTVIRAYEERMDTVIRHPLFGYSVSYRRILGVQARLLARTIAGELPSYRAFTTR
ncbi:MAG: CRISPR-associated endonuclease Cas1 [Actinomycetota bacterium]|nr:CRISPR-associated endonuclease Cas1 [Actinomycetota bacterium]